MNAHVPENDNASRGDLLTKKTTWYVVLGSTAAGVVGIGGFAFLAFLAVLFLVYRYFSRG